MNSSNEPTEPTPSLFERIPSDEYVNEWTEALMREHAPEKPKSTLSLLIFSLGKELLALKTVYVKEVAKSRVVHRIPNRRGAILEGFVNLNGELQLCIALDRFLEIETTPAPLLDKDPHHQQRMIAIVKEGELWVFSVDGIEGIFNVDLSTIENVPVNISKSPVNYIKGIMKMGGRTVGLLDEELLFPSLRRSLS